MSTGPKEVLHKPCVEDEYQVREERDALRVQLDGIRDALGNGADEELWPPGLTLPEAVRELVESRARFKHRVLVRRLLVEEVDADSRTITVYDEAPVEAPVEAPERAAGKGMDNPSHYAFAITPIDAIEAWDLNFSRGCVVKYIARAPHKGTELQDLEKALRYLEREVARVRTHK